MATVKTRSFELTGADGGPLRGEVRTVGDGDGRPVVIICHGFKGFKDWGFFPHLSARVANAGITTISFNFSGSGVGPDGESFSEPERFGHATHTGDVTDIGIVCDAVRNGSLDVAAPRSLGLFGHSRGGGAAVLFAGTRNDVDALVTWNAIGTVHRWSDQQITEWRREGKLDIVNARTGEVLPLYTDLLDDIEANDRGTLDMRHAAGRIDIPWLIVHGLEDEAVPVGDARRLYDWSGEAAKLQIVEGGGHTFGARHPWAGFTPELTQAMDITAAWFSRHLK